MAYKTVRGEIKDRAYSRKFGEQLPVVDQDQIDGFHVIMFDERPIKVVVSTTGVKYMSINDVRNASNYNSTEALSNTHREILVDAEKSRKDARWVRVSDFIKEFEEMFPQAKPSMDRLSRWAQRDFKGAHPVEKLNVPRSEVDRSGDPNEVFYNETVALVKQFRGTGTNINKTVFVQEFQRIKKVRDTAMATPA